MIREELLALADELEGIDVREGCSTCPANGTKDCHDNLLCEDVIARAAARRIREIAEHDACEEAATTVSAHDLLPEEDLKALAWVREHGGLDEVEKRLMPEGMEWLLDVWPRWSNGEYCKFGDWWKAGKYGEREPQQLSRLVFFTPEQLREWGQDEGENFGYEWDYMRPSDTTYRPDKVEPPAPKVLDADGVEIRVGDTVYEVGGDGTAYVFDGMSEDVDGLAVLHHDGKPYIGTSSRVGQLTHERPVLDADGVPIKVGDTVWGIETGIEFEVTGIASEFEIRVKDESMKIGVWTTPCGFTHAKPELPETWERLDEDAEKNPFDYCKDVGHRLDTCENAERFKSRDLVRRCRALAERGA